MTLSKALVTRAPIPITCAVLNESAMPTVEENLKVWNNLYRWDRRGEEWSSTWGGPEAQWFNTILPRIHAFVPAGHILEIAPGFGRWTHYLKDSCDRLTVVDLATTCIDACRERFADQTHIEYHVNDGRSLEAIEDGSVDFAFSFDSLVHVEADVIASYLSELAKKLKPDGIGFIHHSNAGHYKSTYARLNRLPERIRRAMTAITFEHWRAYSMTAEVFEGACRKAGLLCIGQEIVNWQGMFLIDCFSMFTLPGSRWARENIVVRNHDLMKEARIAASLAPLYSVNRMAVG